MAHILLPECILIYRARLWISIDLWLRIIKPSNLTNVIRIEHCNNKIYERLKGGSYLQKTSID